jgi:hypothetical protein
MAISAEENFRKIDISAAQQSPALFMDHYRMQKISPLSLNKIKITV